MNSKELTEYSQEETIDVALVPIVLAASALGIGLLLYLITKKKNRKMMPPLPTPPPIIIKTGGYATSISSFVIKSGSSISEANITARFHYISNGFGPIQKITISKNNDRIKEYEFSGLTVIIELQKYELNTWVNLDESVTITTKSGDFALKIDNKLTSKPTTEPGISYNFENDSNPPLRISYINVLDKDGNSIKPRFNSPADFEIICYGL